MSKQTTDMENHFGNDDDADDGERPATSQSSTERSAVHPKKKSSTQISVDKVELVLPRGLVPSHELADAADRIKRFANTRTVSSKHESYLKRSILRGETGSTVLINMLPSTTDMRYDAKLTMNPNHLTAKDVAELQRLFKHVFPLGGKDVFAKLLVQRFDTAFDHPTPISRLLVQTVGAPVEKKFCISTDRNGYIGGWYAGSVDAAAHLAMYDQVASDAYKVSVGELPSKRVKPETDAELHFAETGTAGTASTRVEIRRVFDPAARLIEVGEQASKFGQFRVFEITDQNGSPEPQNFCLYLDSIRIRGVAGARAEFLRHHTGRKAKGVIAALEEALAEHAAPWWEKATKNVSVIELLKATPSWSALKVLLD